MEASAAGFAAGRAVEEEVLLLGGEVFEGLLEVDLVFFGGELDEAEEVGEPEPGPMAPSRSGLDQSVMVLAGSKS